MISTQCHGTIDTQNRARISLGQLFNLRLFVHALSRGRGPEGRVRNLRSASAGLPAWPISPQSPRPAPPQQQRSPPSLLPPRRLRPARASPESAAPATRTAFLATRLASRRALARRA